MLVFDDRKLKEKAKRVDHDDAPSGIDDHPFEPRGEWYTLCVHCGLAQAAHTETVVDPREYIGYYSDDNDDD